LNGACDVVEYVGRSPRVLASHRIEGGHGELEAPATARIRVTVDGHMPQTKSIFLDDPRLLQPCLDMRVEKMLDWNTYESIRARLREARLEFTFG
jgi:hypothetical protein